MAITLARSVTSSMREAVDGADLGAIICTRSGHSDGERIWTPVDPTRLRGLTRSPRTRF